MSETDKTDTEKKKGPPAVEVTLKRTPGGRLMMTVNATELHAELRKYGAVMENTGGVTRFTNRPSQDYSTELGGTPRKIQPSALLSIGPNGGPMVYDISGHWAAPPTKENLSALLASVAPVVKRICDHYAPVDMTIRVHKRGA